ncbi:MAG: triose-phosphate isomerase [Bacilli bacterium]
MKNIIMGNWKMNKNKQEILDFVDEVNTKLINVSEVDFGVCIPFVYLDSVDKTGSLKIGAQNMHYLSNGAYTGEISGEMLADIKVEYVIIGHSERRQYYNETNESVNLKIKKALELGLKPIVCCGETKEEYENNATNAIVNEQIIKAFEGITDFDNIVVAYEPIWAIGTGLSANSEIANNVCKYIRTVIKDNFNANVRIQYGGSVKPDNIKEYLSTSDINGALVGGASIKACDFISLIENLKN